MGRRWAWGCWLEAGWVSVSVMKTDSFGLHFCWSLYKKNKPKRTTKYFFWKCEQIKKKILDSPRGTGKRGGNPKHPCKYLQIGRPTASVNRWAWPDLKRLWRTPFRLFTTWAVVDVFAWCHFCPWWVLLGGTVIHMKVLLCSFLITIPEWSYSYKSLHLCKKSILNQVLNCSPF